MQLLSLMLLLGAAHGTADNKAPTAADALQDALRKTIGLTAYAFQISESRGRGTALTVEGVYEKGKPVAFTADKIEFFKQADVLVYKDAGGWQRSKTGTVSDPLRVLGAVAKVRGARLPHEELDELLKGLKEVKGVKSTAIGYHEFHGVLDEAAARKLAPASLRSVARDGSARLWVGTRDGRVGKYTISLRVQGRLGNADIDGQVTQSVTVGNDGTVRVEVPEAAKKALE
jgi:hypothetical protein